MRSMYDYIMSRVDQLSLGDVKDKAIRLHEYQHLIKTAVNHGDLDENDLQYINEIIERLDKSIK